MEMKNIPFGITDWEKIEEVEHKGEQGSAFWKTQEFGGIRVRFVRYTPGYIANH
jgi:hypothetical protein